MLEIHDQHVAFDQLGILGDQILRTVETSRVMAGAADEHQRARLGGEEAARFGELCQQADGETADQIYSQRAVGEIDAAAEVLDEAADRVAENGSNKTANACQKNFDHAK